MSDTRPSTSRGRKIPFWGSPPTSNSTSGGVVPQVVHLMPQKQGNSNINTLPQYSSTIKFRLIKITSCNQKHFQYHHTPIAARQKHYFKDWKNLTLDTNTLSVIWGFKVPFSKTALQHTLTQMPGVNQGDRLLRNIEKKVQFNK